MIILSATTDKLEINLGGAVTTNEMASLVCWRDVTADAYTPGRTLQVSSGASDVDISGSPGSDTQRVIDFIHVRNADTVAQTATITFDANGTEYVLWSGRLASGEGITYSEGQGWQRADLDVTPSDIQEFAASADWTKPTSFTPKFVKVICVGAGGGGGEDGAVPEGGAADAAALDGAAPDGAAPDGAAPDGAAPDGAVPDGAAPDGAAPDGAAPDGAAPDGAAPDGAVPDGAAPDGAAPDGAAPDGAAVHPGVVADVCFGCDGGGVSDPAAFGAVRVGVTVCGHAERVVVAHFGFPSTGGTAAASCFANFSAR